MRFLYREITPNDMPAIFRVRLATRENAYTLEELKAMGITPESVTAKIREDYKGWLCESDVEVVGFSMGNRVSGEMWVIAVLPEFERMGIGKTLLRLVEDWMFAEGSTVLWLTTDIDPTLRAYGYNKR